MISFPFPRLVRTTLTLGPRVRNCLTVQDEGGDDGRSVLVRLHLLRQPVQGRRSEVHRADRRHQTHRQEVIFIQI